MSPEEKEMLQNTFILARENNTLLHQVRGVQKRETLWQIAKLTLIILIALGSFYYIEPYLQKVMDLYSSVTGMEQDVKGVVSGDSLKDLLKKF